MSLHRQTLHALHVLQGNLRSVEESLLKLSLDEIDAEATDLVERVAETIYLHEGGLGSEEDWKAVHGDTPRLFWKTGAPWDTNPAELTEWRRDEYRAQARAALRVLADAPKWFEAITHSQVRALN